MIKYMIKKQKMPEGILKWSHRESNSDLIFRRDLFYPLNYETPATTISRLCECKGSQFGY